MDTAAECGSLFLSAPVFCANQERQKKRKAEQKKVAEKRSLGFLWGIPDSFIVCI